MPMDVEDAFSRLPATHAAALRLQARGLDHDAIAAALGLESSAVALLLQIAEAKLEALLARQGTRPVQAGNGAPSSRGSASTRQDSRSDLVWVAFLASVLVAHLRSTHEEQADGRPGAGPPFS